MAPACGVRAQQNNDNNVQDSTATPPMSMFAQQPQHTDTPFTDMQLEIFEKAGGGELSCGDSCPSDFKDDAFWVRAWSCIVQSCSAGGNNTPVDCLNYFDQGQIDDAHRELGNPLFCNLVKSPGQLTVQALMQAFPNAEKSGFVEGLAYVYAYEHDAQACEQEIKRFIGPYGTSWNPRWYRDMIGCRMLAGETTRTQEEANIALWVSGSCDKITDSEMQQACNAPGAPLPNGLPSGK